MADTVINTTGFAIITEDSTRKITTTVMNFSEQRIFMGISYLILCIIGSFGNILLAIIFYQTWTQLGKIPFYFIASQLLFVDFCIHLSQIAVAIPTTLWVGTRDQLQSYHENPIIQIISMLDTVGFVAGLYFSFIICINRFFVLYLHWGFKIFEKPKIYFCIGGSWISLMAIILASHAFGCAKTFSQTKFFFFYNCGAKNEIGKLIINSLKYASYGIPAIMCLLYLRTFIGFDERFTIKHRNSNSTEALDGTTTLTPISSQPRFRFTSTSPTMPRRISITDSRKFREHNLLMQGMLICAILEFQTLAFTLLPQLGNILGENTAFYTTLIQNWLVIINNSSNPIIMFSFNSILRQRLQKIIKSLKSF